MHVQVQGGMQVSDLNENIKLRATSLAVESFNLGVKSERERIIKLLDIWDCNNDRCDCDSINDCFYRQQLIKLIKGENK